MVRQEIKDRIGVQELKQLQIEILKAIHSFCEEYHIKYSLACGTMLGAVRHKGYIPWDDDIDIYLLRDDYNKLVKLFPNVYHEHYELISIERNKIWSRPYAKAFDNRTLLFENINDSSSIGINIDIYPIDDVPDVKSEWSRYNSIRRFFQKHFLVKIIKLERRRSLWKNSIIFSIKVFLYTVFSKVFSSVF